MNLPNRITLVRLLLSVVLFVLLEKIGGNGGGPGGNGRIWYIAFTLFVVAAGTDWLDGYLARKWGQITAFGRIADPFTDKIIICGVLILLQTYPETSDLVPSWLVLLVVAREFLVSGLRAFIEGHGTSFAASYWGKFKLVMQANYCGSVIFYAAGPQEWVWWYVQITLWGTAISTVGSAVLYISRAAKLLSEDGQ